MTPPFCRLLIPSMSQSLEAASLLQENHPGCFTYELVSIISKIAIAARASDSIAGHLVRTAGAAMLLTNYIDIFLSPDTIEDQFWAIGGHDTFKLGASIFSLISDENRLLTPKEREHLPRHIRPGPFAMRREQEIFNQKLRPNQWEYILAAIVLHHAVLGAGYPTSEPDPERPWIPTIDQLRFSGNRKMREQDIAFLKEVYEGLMRIKQSTNIRDIVNMSQEGLVGNTAVMVALVTAADIFDATRRNYQELWTWEKTTDTIRHIFTNYTSFPPFTVELFMDWIHTFGSVEKYCDTAINAGWGEFAPKVLREHMGTHTSGKSCGVVQLINQYAPEIRPDSQIRTWMNRHILPYILSS